MAPRLKFSWARIRDFISTEEPGLPEVSHETGNDFIPIYLLPSPVKLITWNNSLALQRENSGPLAGCSATDADFARRFKDGSIIGCLNETISDVQQLIRNRPSSYDQRDVDTGYLSYEGSETKCYGSGRTYHPDYCYPKWTAFEARVCDSCNLYQPFDTYWTHAGTVDAGSSFKVEMPCKLAPVTQMTWNTERKEMELLTCNGMGFDHKGIHLGACQNMVRTMETKPTWWDESSRYDTDLTRLACNPESQRFVYKVNTFDVCTHCRAAGKNYLVAKFEKGISIVKRVFLKKRRPYSKKASRILRQMQAWDRSDCCEDDICPFKTSFLQSQSAPVAFTECGPECMYDEEYNPEHYDCPLVSQDAPDVYDTEYAAMRYTEAYNNHTAKHVDSIASRFLRAAVPLLLKSRTPRPTKAILNFDYSIPDYDLDPVYTVADYAFTFEGEIYETRTIQREVSPAIKTSVSKPWTPPERVTKFLEHFTFGKASNSAAGHKGAHGTFRCQGCKSYVGQGVTCFYEGDTFCRTCAGEFATEFLELNLDMPTFEELKENKAKCNTMVHTETYTPAKTEDVVQYRYRIVTVRDILPDLVQSERYDPYNGIIPSFVTRPCNSPTKCVDIEAHNEEERVVPCQRPPPFTATNLVAFRLTSGPFKVHWELASEDGSKLGVTDKGILRRPHSWSPSYSFEIRLPRPVSIDVSAPASRRDVEKYGICGSAVRGWTPHVNGFLHAVEKWLKFKEQLPLSPTIRVLPSFDPSATSVTDSFLRAFIPEYGMKISGLPQTCDEMANVEGLSFHPAWGALNIPVSNHTWKEFNDAIAHGFTVTSGLKPYLWPNTPGYHKYDLEEAYIVATLPGWDAVLIKTQLTFWSSPPTIWSASPLPFASHTSPIHLRSVPYHDHRWIAKARGDYGVVIPQGMPAPTEPPSGFTLNGLKQTLKLEACGHEVDPIRHVFGSHTCHQCVSLHGLKAMDGSFWSFVTRGSEHQKRDIMIKGCMYMGVRGRGAGVIACKAELSTTPHVFSKLYYVDPESTTSKRITFPIKTFVRASVAVPELTRIEFSETRTLHHIVEIPAFTVVDQSFIDNVVTEDPHSTRATFYKQGGALEICWAAENPYYDTDFLNDFKGHPFQIVHAEETTRVLSDHIDHGQRVIVFENPRVVPSTHEEQVSIYSRFRNRRTLGYIPFKVLANGKPLRNPTDVAKGGDSVWRPTTTCNGRMHGLEHDLPTILAPPSKEMENAIEAMSRSPNPRIIVSACATRPPVSGWDAFSIGRGVKGWTTVCKGITGREAASLRLLGLFAKGKTHVWIQNGRDGDEELYHFDDASLQPGWNTAPSPSAEYYGINLRSSIYVSDGIPPLDLEEFAGSCKLAGVYGHDEYYIAQHFKTAVVHLPVRRSTAMFHGHTFTVVPQAQPPSSFFSGRIPRT
uniref:Uncharacterized protein n=1 Tax=Rhizoctonia solani hypovirus 2 TaxID=2599958 RepID=A0A5B8GQ99_9VIRU|nr:hypothetical protein [Rhizoctonia solani hypovirus 2]